MAGSDSETWRDVAGWEGLYQVSSHGRVRSLDRFISCPTARRGTTRRYRGRVLSPGTKRHKGKDVTYRVVCFTKPGSRVMFRVARLVADAFISGSGPQVRHLDGDGMNDHISNLAWGTQSDNEQDKVVHGRSNHGDRNGMRRRTL